jgi:hypothetical protein
MSDEELEKLCSKLLDRMMTDDRFFLHMVIQGFGRRIERLAKEHEENKEVCPKCGFFKDHCVCEKPQTNADRIRSMNDEELAENVSCPYIATECIHLDDDIECEQCKLQWLKSAKE